MADVKGEGAVSDVVERLIRYCEVASQSDPLTADKVPSTSKQFDMANVIAEDLRALGAQDVEVDEHAYVTAHWPASEGCEGLPCLGFCGHIDTAWQSYGDPVHPQVVRYEGGPLVMGEVDGKVVAATPEQNPELKRMVGWDIVCTDGTSLLGGDDKAGDAAIISLLARLAADPSIPHPRLALAFVPDEEIGHGAALLDLEKWGATWGYTLDGGPLGELCHENFNAAEAKLTARGFSVHTGTAKGKMINASEVIIRFHELLPAAERPEFTDGRDGFYYLERMEGNCEEASSAYIIRDHSSERFAERKRLMERAVELVNEQFGSEVLGIEIRDQYRNMADVIADHPHLVENARKAFAGHGVEMYEFAMRGGTDGAQLSYRGLPCPNLSACYYNAHGVKEFVPVPELETMVDVLETLVGLYAVPVE